VADSVLEVLIRRLIKGDGVMNRTNVEDEDGVLRKLADFVLSFKRGSYSTVYLPFAYPLKGFGGVEEILNISHSPEDTYSNVAKLINELKSAKYVVHRESFEKCLEIAQELLNHEAFGFVEKYLTINAALFKDILDFLYIRSSIFGSQQAYESSILAYSTIIPRLSSNILEAYRRCMKAVVKGHRIEKRKYAIARFFDSVLIIVGGAAHTPASIAELKFGRGRKESYTFYATPFTRALRRVIDSEFEVEPYIDSLKKFVEFVVESFMEKRDPMGVADYMSPRVLEPYTWIGVELDRKAIYNTVHALWSLLNVMKSRGLI